MAFFIIGGFIFTLVISGIIIFLAVMSIYGIWKSHEVLGLKHPWYSLFAILNIWQIVELMVAEEEDDTIPLAFGIRVPYHLFICNSIIVAIPAAIPIVGGLLSLAAMIIIQKTFYSKLLCLLNGESCLDTMAYDSDGWLYAFFPFILGFRMKKNWQKYVECQG